jgi:hypothetical protein
MVNEVTPALLSQNCEATDWLLRNDALNASHVIERNRLSATISAVPINLEFGRSR